MVKNLLRGVLSLGAVTILSSCGSGKYELSVRRPGGSSEIQIQQETKDISCTTMTASLTMVTPVTQVKQGDEIVWKVSVSGCNKFILTRDNASAVTFFSNYYYTRRYTSAAQNFVERVTLVGYDGNGSEEYNDMLASDVFNIVAGSGGDTSTELAALSCSAFAIPNYINVRVDPSGKLLDVAPYTTMTVYSSRMSYLQMAVTAGAATPVLPISAEAGSVFPVYLSNLGIGLNLIRFTVIEKANPLNKAECIATVAVNPVVMYPLPSPTAPTCSLTASTSSTFPGYTINFTLNSSGNSQSATFDGETVTAKSGSVNQTFKRTASSTRTYTATVVGDGGTSSCSAKVAVNQNKIGWNFEDATDWDFNDLVLCGSGYFYLSDGRFQSTANQTINFSLQRRSPCVHNVWIKVYNASGALTWQGTYDDQISRTIAVTINQGYSIEAKVRSISGCSATKAWQSFGSQYLQTAHYCFETGN